MNLNLAALPCPALPCCPTARRGPAEALKPCRIFGPLACPAGPLRTCRGWSVCRAGIPSGPRSAGMSAGPFPACMPAEIWQDLRPCRTAEDTRIWAFAVSSAAVISHTKIRRDEETGLSYAIRQDLGYLD